MGFEPTTFCLGSRHSTPELHPLGDGARSSPTQILSNSGILLKGPHTNPETEAWVMLVISTSK